MKIGSLYFFLLLIFVSSCSKDSKENPEDKIYVIDNSKFGISANKSNARATTDGINAAIEYARYAGYKTIKFPQGEYLITCISDHTVYPSDGIFLQSNVTYDLSDAKFFVEPNDSPMYCVFQLENVENATIIGGEVFGDMDSHIYPSDQKELVKHQHGSAFHLYSCENILIKNVKISDVIGSAISLIGYNYLHLYQHFPNNNIRITGCEFTNCGLKGVKINHATNVEIDHNKFSDFSNRTGLGVGWAMCGIKSEKYTNDRIIRHMKIHDNSFKNCMMSIIVHNSDDSEVYDNVSEGDHMAISISRRVRVYRNTVTKAYIYAEVNNEDICIAANGSDKNNCSDIRNKAENFTGNFPCN